MDERNLRVIRRLTIEPLESRQCMAADDLAELNAVDWDVFASDQAVATIVDDRSLKLVGEASLRFDTKSGFDTGVKYPKLGNANWDLSTKDYFTFLEYADNPNPLGFQGNQPTLVLRGNSGSFTYTPKQQLVTEFQWQKFAIPLQGNAFWARQSVGSPSLSDIDQFEIHWDTWDYGFKIYLDSVRFESSSNLPSPPPPAGVDPNVVKSKALLYAFDPVMENLGSKRQHDAYQWQDPIDLTNRVIEDLRVSSHGRLDYQLVETIIADKHPYFKDGFQHTDASFAAAWSARDFHNSEFDYPRFILENGIASRIDRGEIDEVWIYSGPISGTWESAMAGEGAFWINGPTQSGGGKRAFPIMGWNFERGVGEAIHSFGHRAESTLDHAYRNWSKPGVSTWKQFATIDRDAPSNGAVGNVHFPVNGTGDYDYNNSRSVMSTALDWKNYPNLTGAKTSVSNRTWSPDGSDPQRQYLNWWYGLMPSVSGQAPDGYLGNWWRYLSDVDAIKVKNADLANASSLTDVFVEVVSLPSNGDSPSTIEFLATALSDGAVGRVDFYVDGIYQASDTMAPYSLKWNAGGITGSRTVVAKAYELVHGWEFASAPSAFTILATAWHNSNNPRDVDSDLSISPLDVLTLINDLNALGTRRLPSVRPVGQWFLDVDNDGSATPLDVLMLINFINAGVRRGSGEGEWVEQRQSKSVNQNDIAFQELSWIDEQESHYLFDPSANPLRRLRRFSLIQKG